MRTKILVFCAVLLVAISSAFVAVEITQGQAVAQKYMGKYVYIMSEPNQPFEIVDAPDFTYYQLVFSKPADYWETAIETASKKFGKYNLEWDGMIMDGKGSCSFIKFTE